MRQFKIYLRPFLYGLVVTIILTLTMLQVTMDFIVLLYLGSLLFFLAGLINSKLKLNRPIAAVTTTIVYSSLFFLIILEEIPRIGYFIAIFYTACLLGFYFNRYKKTAMIGSILFVGVIVIVTTYVVPADVTKSLTHERQGKVPYFQLNDLNGDLVSSDEFKNKVLIIDFFGTWCKPCINELSELDQVQKYFRSNENVEFLIINADLGGDTPEKFKKFVLKSNYDFTFLYDNESEFFNALELGRHGLPSLFIVDKKQNIRFFHVGYNLAETNFSEIVIDKINESLSR